MPAQRFLIAPYNESSGLTSNVKPWQIPDNAFSTLQNAYVWRGRVRKRFGSRWFDNDQTLSRLRYDVGEYSITLPKTDGAGNAAGTVTAALYQLGQYFVIGAETDTVTNPAAGPQAMTSTGPSVTHTFDITNGAYNFVGAPINTTIYFFPNPLVTDVAGTISGVLPNAPIAIGTMFSIGDVLFTVNTLGTPADLLISNGSATTAQLDTTTGEFTFVGVLDSGGSPVANTSVYFYPSLPVMGLLNIETSVINNEPIVGFDTRFAYNYTSGSGWQRLANETDAGAATWTGSNSQLFWGCSWTGADPSDVTFYVTNFNENEPNYMRVLDYSTLTWSNFRPQIYNTPSNIYINSARIIVVFYNRLVLLNTWEGSSTGGTNYTGRARWSEEGNPLDPNAFILRPGRDKALDASTTEAIIGAEFVKDRLIVFFERSTWEFVYMGNQASTPFRWQKINTELGSESTFSTIPFDKSALAIGNTGIHSCNGANVDRIDNKIPASVFDIVDVLNDPTRVYGIRDYYLEVSYWAYVSTERSQGIRADYNNQILVYNYRNDTWASNDDSITCFGYYQATTANGELWSSSVLWDSSTLWSGQSGQTLFRKVAAGNQQGYTFLCEDNTTTNARVLQLTDVDLVSNLTELTIIDHNLIDGDFIYINGATWDDASNGLNNLIFKVQPVLTAGSVDKNKVIITPNASFTGTYTGGGTVARVSKIDIITKQYNFFAEKFRNAYISRVDFMVDRTNAGQLTVYYILNSQGDSSYVAESINSGVILGTSTLDTFPYTSANFSRGVRVFYEYENIQQRLWHPVYFQAEGQVVSFELTMNDAQMLDVDNSQSDFQMHAMAITAEPTTDRFQ